ASARNQTTSTGIANAKTPRKLDPTPNVLPASDPTSWLPVHLLLNHPLPPLSAPLLRAGPGSTRIPRVLPVDLAPRQHVGRLQPREYLSQYPPKIVHPRRGRRRRGTLALAG